MLRSFLLGLLAATSAVGALAPPACQGLAPNQSVISVQNANLTGLPSPFSIVYASKDIAFVATSGNSTVSLINTTSFQPTFIRSYPLTFTNYFGGPLGLALTSDKKTLYAAAGKGAVAIDVDLAIAGAPNPVVGNLTGTYGSPTAIQVLVAPGDEYVFVTIEDNFSGASINGGIEVFRTSRAANGSVASSYIGALPLYGSVVGMAVSANKKLLYTTSETYNNTQEGVLSIIDLAKLETAPPTALIGNVGAGCTPVRVVVSPLDGNVWVTARASNMVVVFNATLLQNPNVTGSDALIATAQVGTLPVDLIFVNHGRHLLTADSSRFYPNAVTGISVLDVAAVMKGVTAPWPRIPTGLFPREFALSPNGKTVLVANYASNLVQALNITQLTPAE